MSFHWKVLLWLAAGVLTGFAIQQWTEGRAWSGAQWRPVDGGLELVSARGPASKLPARMVASAAVADRGTPAEQRVELRAPEDLEALVATRANGDVLWLERPGRSPVLVTLGLDPDSPRATWVAPLELVADLFMALLRMLIVPLVATSILVGVAGIGTGADLGRLGGKAIVYYLSTSLLAIFVGQALVTALEPGTGASLGLPAAGNEGMVEQVSFLAMLRGAVPNNVFGALSDNGAMLQIIFVALVFGFFLARTPEPHKSRLMPMFESLLAMVMRLAEGVLKLIPYGVFALMGRVVATTGFSVFRPLLVYMAIVAAALVLHAAVTLPLVLRVVGGVSPRRWLRAMAPRL
jgi:proton glutamate symport protein